MTIHILLLVLVLIIFHICTRFNRRGRLMNKIPGPTAYPIVGNLLIFINCNLDELWRVGREMIKKYYPITKIWGFTTALVNISHPDDLQILLSDQNSLEKGYVYWYFHPWLKTGLLTSCDKKWRHRRKVLTPAFHFDILKKYMEIICEQGEKMVTELKDEGRETVKSLIPFCSNYTLNIICESTMGVALDKMEYEAVSKYREAVRNMSSIIMYRLPRPYIVEWMMPYIPKVGKMQKNALQVLHEFTDRIINERRKHYAKNDRYFLTGFNNDVKETALDVCNIDHKRRLAMLDLLLEAEKNNLIDNEGIKEEVDTFTFEGHDTSGMGMTYILMLLAENKEAQEKARDEVSKILDNSNGKIGITEIQNFNYLERCIKEALRLYPPVATMMRFTKKDLQLKHALIPANTHCLIHLWDTHRDPNFWTNPGTFDPNRFLPENMRNRHPFAYLPFSAGPRNCIGQKFAMMELKILTARILYNFYLVPMDITSNMKLMADIVLRPTNPIHIKFININK